MEQPRKQDTNTGSGDGKIPILANANPSTAARSKQSRKSTDTASNNTKPVSNQEALSLLQTICSDLQSLGLEISILARNDSLYIRVKNDTGKLDFIDGHIVLDGKPVSSVA
jgi:hypothetical protein